MTEAVEVTIELTTNDIQALIYTSVATLFTTICITWALHTVHKNRRLTPIVKFYLFYEHALRLAVILIHFLWGSVCTVWNVGETLPMLDYIIGYVYQFLWIAVYLAQISFSLNRFFAISFHGKYYDRLFSGKWMPQAIFFTLFAMVTSAVTLVPGNYSYFVRSIYTFWGQDGLLFFLFNYGMQSIFPIVTWTITLILDFVMLKNLNAQRKLFASRTSAMRTEWRLAMQMMLNHCANVANIIDWIIVFGEVLEYTFLLNIFGILLMIVLPGLYGLNVVIFLGNRFTRRRLSVAPTSMMTTTY